LRIIVFAIAEITQYKKVFIINVFSVKCLDPTRVDIFKFEEKIVCSYGPS